MSRTRTLTILLVISLGCSMLAVGCGPDCVTGGLQITDVTLEPATPCIQVDYVHPDGLECASRTIRLVNSCKKQFAVDVTKAAFKIVSGDANMKASGGAATLEMDQGSASKLEGTHKIPCLLGTDLVQMSVRISYLAN